MVNFQSTIEAANWGIDSDVINESCQNFNILMINSPIRYASFAIFFFLRKIQLNILHVCLLFKC